MTTKRYRLTARAQMHGAVREPGYVFTLAEGEKGPYRTVVASNHGAQITDHLGDHASGLVDEPLYVEVPEPAPPAPVSIGEDAAPHDGGSDGGHP